MFDKTDYICLTVTADPERHEGLVAWLSTLEFEAFEEEEHALKAYARKEAFDEAGVNEIMKVAGVTKANYTSNLIKARNWNAEWEAAYDAVEIDDFCQIVPSFHHAKDGFTHTIHLDPKMSFGTGHHETTRLMVRQMKGMDIAGVLNGGLHTSRYFIENTREHGEKIIQNILLKSSIT